MKRLVLGVVFAAAGRRGSHRGLLRQPGHPRSPRLRLPGAIRQRGAGAGQPAGEGRRAALRGPRLRPLPRAERRRRHPQPARRGRRQHDPGARQPLSRGGRAVQQRGADHAGADEGGIVSKKPGVINMPSWNGVIKTAQADALAAYILAGVPITEVAYDAEPANARHLQRLRVCRLSRAGRPGRHAAARAEPEDRGRGRAGTAQPGRPGAAERDARRAHGRLDPRSGHEGRLSSCRHGPDPVARPAGPRSCRTSRTGPRPRRCRAAGR